MVAAELFHILLSLSLAAVTCYRRLADERIYSYVSIITFISARGVRHLLADPAGNYRRLPEG